MLNEHQTAFRCPYCGVISYMVWVHGHGQCNLCKINVDECCRGEDASCKMEINSNVIIKKSPTK